MVRPRGTGPVAGRSGVRRRLPGRTCGSAVAGNGPPRPVRDPLGARTGRAPVAVRSPRRPPRRQGGSAGRPPARDAPHSAKPHRSPRPRSRRSRPPRSAGAPDRRGARNPGGQAFRRGVVDIALCAVMRDALRRSEAAALTWADVELRSDGSARVTVRRSKTDPEGEGAVQYIGPAASKALQEIRPREAFSGRARVFGLLSGRAVSLSGDGASRGTPRYRKTIRPVFARLGSCRLWWEAGDPEANGIGDDGTVSSMSVERSGFPTTDDCRRGFRPGPTWDPIHAAATRTGAGGVFGARGSSAAAARASAMLGVFVMPAPPEPNGTGRGFPPLPGIGVRVRGLSGPAVNARRWATRSPTAAGATSAPVPARASTASAVHGPRAGQPFRTTTARAGATTWRVGLTANTSTPDGRRTAVRPESFEGARQPGRVRPDHRRGNAVPHVGPRISTPLFGGWSAR